MDKDWVGVKELMIRNLDKNSKYTNSLTETKEIKKYFKENKF
jgi:hypothetical protein